MAAAVPVPVQFYDSLGDGRVLASTSTLGRWREASRGVGFGDGGEVPTGDAQVERLPSGPHIAVGVVVLLLGAWYSITGYAKHPPNGVQSWIDLELLPVEPEVAQKMTFEGQPVTFGGQELFL